MVLGPFAKDLTFFTSWINGKAIKIDEWKKIRWGKVVESGFTVNVLLLVASLLNTYYYTEKEHEH